MRSRKAGGFKLYLMILIILGVFHVAAVPQQPDISSRDVGLGGSNRIIGTVLTSDNQRIGTRLNVQISTMTRGDVNTVTNENGDFGFRGLTSGTYTIVIDKEKNFEPFIQQISVIQLPGSPPGTYYVNARLNRKSTSEGKPGVVNSELAQMPESARNFYNNGVELSKEGKYKEAIEQLNSAVEVYPDFMLAYSELGVLNLKIGELEKADEFLSKALEIAPDAFLPIVNRGIVLFTMKRYAEAEPLLRAAKKQDENSAVVDYFLGQTVANLGHFEEAEKLLVSALKLGGDQMKEARRILAIIYASRGENKRAAKELEEYLRVFPATPDAEQLKEKIRILKNLKGS